MRKILNTAIPIIVPFFLASCVVGNGSGVPEDETRGFMNVEVVTPGADTDDYIRTVRYFVFGNASTAPELYANEIMTVDDTAKDAVAFTSTLRVTCNDDIMIITVVNEPSSLTPILEMAVSPYALEDLLYPLDDAFNLSYTGLKDAYTGIPMTGVKRHVSVTEAHNSVANAQKVQTWVERAVARVELWLRKDPLITSAKVGTGTTIVLADSHDQGYLVTGTQRDFTRYQTGEAAADNFGHMLTVMSPYFGTQWSPADSSSEIALQDDDAVLVCYFYAPERTCSIASDQSGSDKLKLYIRGLDTSDGQRNADIILDLFTSDKGVETALDTIKRNNVYRITGLLKKNQMDSETRVLPWEPVDVGVIIDPLYYINVSRDILYLYSNGAEATVRVETNYDRGDRGFDPGIYIDPDIAYFDSNGNPMTSSNGDRYGWITMTHPAGSDGDMEREFTVTVNNEPSDDNRNGTARIGLTAGNMTKYVYVMRAG